MTDEEILKRAEEIKARRALAAKARGIFGCELIRITGQSIQDYEADHSFTVTATPELAAYLSHVIGCSIMEGAEGDQEKDFT